MYLLISFIIQPVTIHANAFIELTGRTTLVQTFSFQRERTLLDIRAILLAIIYTEEKNFYLSGLAQQKIF